MKLEEGAGTGSGLKVIRRWSRSPSLSPAAISRRIGTNAGVASGVVDQTMLGASRYRSASHFAHAQLLLGDVLTIRLVVDGHRDGEAVLAHRAYDGIHIREVRFVRRQRSSPLSSGCWP